MGDGKNLKKYLDEKSTNVRKIAKATGIKMCIRDRFLLQPQPDFFFTIVVIHQKILQELKE